MIFNRFTLICLMSFMIVQCGAVDETTNAISENASNKLTAAISPTQPLVLNAPRTFFVGLDQIVTLEAPNAQLQVRLDNKEHDEAVTIVQGRLRVIGPKETKTLYLDPLQNMISLQNNGSISFVSRPFLAEIRAGRKSTCMDKVTYLNLASNAEACPANEDLVDNGTQCCPSGLNSLQSIWFLVGPLQTFSEEELDTLGPTVYSFQLDLIGWVGTVTEPIANFRKTIFFTSSSL